MQLGEIVKLFPNLESLDLTQHDDSTDPDDYMPEFWQLPALARLKSLKVHWDWDCNVIRQVSIPTYYTYYKKALKSCNVQSHPCTQPPSHVRSLL